jgi:hypothetical protein
MGVTGGRRAKGLVSLFLACHGMARVSSNNAQGSKGGTQMLELLGELISRRSFSSLWYWIAVAAFWVLITRRVMGLPQDMLQRARAGGDDLGALETMAHLQAQRLMRYWRQGAVFGVALASGVLALTTVLAFWHGVELAQALWFLICPLVIIWAMSARAAMLVLNGFGQGDALLKVMYRFRFRLQLIAIAFVFTNIIFALGFLVSQYGVR